MMLILIFDKNEYPDEYYAEVMDTMYMHLLEESYNGQRTWDVTKFKFQILIWTSKKRLKLVKRLRRE